MRWMEAIHPEDRTRVSVMGRSPGLRRPLETQYRLLRVDGTYGWLHHAAVPIADEHGKLTGYLGSCTDITEQRSRELKASARSRRSACWRTTCRC
jgi:PAS domain S-box-containing protein